MIDGGELPPPAPCPPPSPCPRVAGIQPALWSREDVLHWLRWAEGEYALQPTREHGFDMNGRALCILTKDDFRLRAPGSGQGNSLVSLWSVLMDTRLGPRGEVGRQLGRIVLTSQHCRRPSLHRCLPGGSQLEPAAKESTWGLFSEPQGPVPPSHFPLPVAPALVSPPVSTLGPLISISAKLETGHASPPPRGR